jgi:hypothetical protein
MMSGMRGSDTKPELQVGQDHQAVLNFATDLKAHDGLPAQVRHVCQDMGVAFSKEVAWPCPVANLVVVFFEKQFNGSYRAT